MNDHLDVKQSIVQLSEERRSRIQGDIEKLKNHPDWDCVPPILAAYIDCLILDVDLLFRIEDNMQQHIDSLDAMITRLTERP